MDAKANLQHARETEAQEIHYLKNVLRKECHSLALELRSFETQLELCADTPAVSGANQPMVLPVERLARLSESITELKTKVECYRRHQFIDDLIGDQS